MGDHNVKASFFFTGRFYRNENFRSLIQQLKKNGHYLGAHSDAHLLYCDWKNRDSLLVTKKEFTEDLLRNYAAMKNNGMQKQDALFFLPPYEWYNDTIAAWTRELGLQLVNYTPGTKTHADYTTPAMKNYVPGTDIFNSVLQYENRSGLNGFILLMHAGTDPARTDKFYYKLPALLGELKKKGYNFVRIDKLLK